MVTLCKQNHRLDEQYYEKQFRNITWLKIKSGSWSCYGKCGGCGAMVTKLTGGGAGICPDPPSGRLPQGRIHRVQLQGTQRTTPAAP